MSDNSGILSTHYKNNDILIFKINVETRRL